MQIQRFFEAQLKCFTGQRYDSHLDTLSGALNMLRAIQPGFSQSGLSAVRVAYRRMKRQADLLPENKYGRAELQKRIMSEA